MSLLDTASLIVTPNGYKEGKLYSVIPSDGSGDLSVTRATTATRVNSAGLVELVPYNLVQYSQEITNGVWEVQNGGAGASVTRTANYGLAPDGTMTADRLQLNKGFSGYAEMYQFPVATQIGAQYTFSAYVKSLSGNVSFLFGFNGSARELENATTEWTRITWTTTATGAQSAAAISLVDSYNPSTSASVDLLVWGFQIEEGSVAKDYQKTETRLNIPRLDYSNGTCPSILVEPQRTNLVTYSEDFNSSNGYTYQNASFSSSSIVSPSGLTAKGITSTTSANDFHRFYKSLGGLTGTYTTTIYGKKGTSRYLGLGINQNGSTGNNNVVVFDLQDGVIASNIYGVTASIQDVGNGWYRCEHTFNYGTGGTYADICVHNTGTGAFTINAFQTFDSPTAPTTLYIYGLQLEAGSYATSYIPTTSASVTRNADLITKTSATALIGQTEGTIFGELYVIPQKADSMLCLIANTTGGLYSDFFYIRASNGVPAVSVRQGDVTYVAIDGTTALSEGFHKFAFAYKQNDFAFYVDGVLIGTDTSGNVPTCNSIYLGQYLDGFDREVSKKSFALWKTRLTNAQLATLTTI